MADVTAAILQVRRQFALPIPLDFVAIVCPAAVLLNWRVSIDTVAVYQVSYYVC